MKILKLTILFGLLNYNVFALAETDAVSFSAKNEPILDYSDIASRESHSQYLNSQLNIDWIKTNPNYFKNDKQILAIVQNNSFTSGKKLAFEWDLSNYLSLNLSFFENQVQFGSNYNPSVYTSLPSFNKSYTSSVATVNNTYRNLRGYSFGVSSEVNLWQNYKLDINFDYGLLNGADLVGFSNNDINTTSFALGIRKAKFGATVNTDVYLQDNVNLYNSSRLGLELDWHFNEDSKISIGTKTRLSDIKQTSNNHNSLDSITGNVQYIKFEHNL